MATADQYAAWIVKNEAKKGTPEFDTVARAYKQAVAEESPREPIVDNLNAQTLNPTGSFMENVAAGAGKTMYDVARGGGQRLREVIEAITPRKVGELVTGQRNTLADTLGLPNQADVDASRTRDAALSATGGGKVGQVVGALPVALIPGANTYTGAALVGAGMGALQPTAADESVAKNVALGGASGAAGKYVGDWVANKVGAKLANAYNAEGAKAAANAEKDATLAAARARGFVVPPSQVEGAGMAARSLEGFSNKINVQQTASLRNQQAINEVARDALKLPKDAPLNEATLNAVREQAGQAYKAVENIKTILWDPKFMQEVKGLGRNITGGVTSNPADAKIAALQSELGSLTRVDGKALIADIKNLREMAKANFAAASAREGDVGAQALGQAQSKAAAMLEGLAERNLQVKGGSPEIIKAFQEARKTIAKTYTIEDAIREGSGNVSLHKLASALNRGTPLEGGLLDAAKFANTFHKAAQSPERIGSVPMFTMTDVVAGGVGGAINPLLGAAALARPAARNIALSKLMQNSLANPNYGPGLALRGADKLAWNPAVRALLPGLAAQGGLAYGAQE